MPIAITKTEAIWSATSLRQTGVRVDDDVILPAKSFRDLCGPLSARKITTTSHVTKTVWRFLAALRQQPTFRHSVPCDIFRSLIAFIVITRIDYGNAALAGISTVLVNRPQAVLNAAARKVVGLRQRDHVTQSQRQCC